MIRLHWVCGYGPAEDHLSPCPAKQKQLYFISLLSGVENKFLAVLVQ